MYCAYGQIARPAVGVRVEMALLAHQIKKGKK
jgi:hypothetical protein